MTRADKRRRLIAPPHDHARSSDSSNASRLLARKIPIERLEPLDALVGGMELQFGQAVDQLEDGGGPEFAFAQNDPIARAAVPSVRVTP